MGKRIAIATIVRGALISILAADGVRANGPTRKILRILTSGPEGSRVQITGKNLQEPSAVFLAAPTRRLRSFHPKNS